MRSSQTLKTIKSIKKIEKHSRIIYVDGGLQTKGVKLWIFKKLISFKVDQAFFLHEDQELIAIRDLLKNESSAFEVLGLIGLSKSIMEIICYERALSFIRSNYSNNLLIKISGRYTFNSQFNIKTIESLISQSVFIFLESSDTYLQQNASFPKFFRTVAWCANMNFIDEIQSTISLAKSYLAKAIIDKKILDLEHALFKATMPLIVTEIERLHVNGPIGPTGEFIEL